jgi:acetyl-CoA carboxylase carboxyltransferase component
VPALTSALDVRSEAYLAARQAAQEVLDAYAEQAQIAAAGGGPKARQRLLSRGKLPVRERVALLLDRAGVFLELSPIAGWGSDDPLGGGMVTGIGQVRGRWVMVIANDPTQRGGSLSPTSVAKTLRAMEVAGANRLPVVLLVESGGADLPKQADIFVPGGEQFRRLAQLSRAGCTTIAAVFGSSTAGGAYLPGMSDYTVLVKERAQVFLGGPPLVKMAIDEDVDEETLGGADMHARVSGLADYLAVDEADALRLTREIVGRLPAARRAPGGAPPRFDPEELLGVVPADIRVPFDMREVLARFVDGSEFEEFKGAYGTNLVCGWMALHGMPVAVLANNGVLFNEESQKGAQFIQLVERQGVPLLFCQNITGFMIGSEREKRGIIKDGAKLINAVSNVDVPKLTLMVGASYGAGNYAMAGRSYEPRLVLSWPSHRIAVMGGRQLAGVMSIVRRRSAESRGEPYDEATDAAVRAATERQIEEESSPLYATGRLWDDGMIDPRLTRHALGVALCAATQSETVPSADYGVWRH